jgi:hypothetical protein
MGVAVFQSTSTLQLGVGDPLEIWRMLPALEDLPESLLRQLSRSEICQLNAALAKENKIKIQTNSRLMMNAQQLEKKPCQSGGRTR